MADDTRQRVLTAEVELHVAVLAMKAATECVEAKSVELDALHVQLLRELREPVAADAPMTRRDPDAEMAARGLRFDSESGVGVGVSLVVRKICDGSAVAFVHDEPPSREARAFMNREGRP